MTEHSDAAEPPNRPEHSSNMPDAEWEFLLPYLTLVKEDAPQRDYDLRGVFNDVRYVVRTGVQLRYLLNDFPPHNAVYQQARRWLHAGVYENIAHDLRIILASWKTVPKSQLPPSLMVERFAQHARVATEPATTATRRSGDPRFILPLIRSETYSTW